MKLKRIILLIIPIIIIFTLISQNVFAAGIKTYDSSVDHTYTWASGIYKKEIEKDTYVTLSNMRSNIVVYKEIDKDNVEIEPSVGYAYYMAKSYGLDDPDMQSVIAMSDQWGNDSNMKTKGSKQDMDGNAVLSNAFAPDTQKLQNGSHFHRLSADICRFRGKKTS